MKVFVDANILFSAADPASATRRLLDVVARHAAAITCPHAMEEARRNLELKRPARRQGLDEVMEFVTVSHAFSPPKTDLPSSDIPILAGALGTRCTHLWSSDKKHFGSYYGRTLAGIRVVSSVLMADDLAEQGWRVTL